MHSNSLEFWATHPANNEYWQTMNSLRQRRVLCDITLHIKDKGSGATYSFPAHKIVLISASVYFQHQFDNGFLSDHFILDHQDKESLKFMLDLIYGVVKPFSCETLEHEVCNLAELLKIDDFKDRHKQFCDQIKQQTVSLASEIHQRVDKGTDPFIYDTGFCFHEKKDVAIDNNQELEFCQKVNRGTHIDEDLEVFKKVHHGTNTDSEVTFFGEVDQRITVEKMHEMVNMGTNTEAVSENIINQTYDKGVDHNQHFDLDSGSDQVTDQCSDLQKVHMQIDCNQEFELCQNPNEMESIRKYDIGTEGKKYRDIDSNHREESIDNDSCTRKKAELIPPNFHENSLHDVTNQVCKQVYSERGESSPLVEVILDRSRSVLLHEDHMDGGDTSENANPTSQDMMNTVPLMQTPDPIDAASPDSTLTQRNCDVQNLKRKHYDVQGVSVKRRRSGKSVSPLEEHDDVSDGMTDPNNEGPPQQNSTQTMCLESASVERGKSFIVQPPSVNENVTEKMKNNSSESVIVNCNDKEENNSAKISVLHLTPDAPLNKPQNASLMVQSNDSETTHFPSMNNDTQEIPAEKDFYIGILKKRITVSDQKMCSGKNNAQNTIIKMSNTENGWETQVQRVSSSVTSNKSKSPRKPYIPSHKELMSKYTLIAPKATFCTIENVYSTQLQIEPSESSTSDDQASTCPNQIDNATNLVSVSSQNSPTSASSQTELHMQDLKNPTKSVSGSLPLSWQIKNTTNGVSLLSKQSPTPTQLMMKANNPVLIRPATSLITGNVVNQHELSGYIGAQPLCYVNNHIPNSSVNLGSIFGKQIIVAGNDTQRQMPATSENNPGQCPLPNQRSVPILSKKLCRPVNIQPGIIVRPSTNQMILPKPVDSSKDKTNTAHTSLSTSTSPVGNPTVKQMIIESRKSRRREKSTKKVSKKSKRKKVENNGKAIDKSGTPKSTHKVKKKSKKKKAEKTAKVINKSGTPKGIAKVILHGDDDETAGTPYPMKLHCNASVDSSKTNDRLNSHCDPVENAGNIDIDNSLTDNLISSCASEANATEPEEKSNSVETGSEQLNTDTSIMHQYYTEYNNYLQKENYLMQSVKVKVEPVDDSFSQDLVADVVFEKDQHLSQSEALKPENDMNVSHAETLSNVWDQPVKVRKSFNYLCPKCDQLFKSHATFYNHITKMKAKGDALHKDLYIKHVGQSDQPQSGTVSDQTKSPSDSSKESSVLPSVSSPEKSDSQKKPEASSKDLVTTNAQQIPLSNSTVSQTDSANWNKAVTVAWKNHRLVMRKPQQTSPTSSTVTQINAAEHDTGMTETTKGTNLVIPKPKQMGMTSVTVAQVNQNTAIKDTSKGHGLVVLKPKPPQINLTNSTVTQTNTANQNTAITDTSKGHGLVMLKPKPQQINLPNCSVTQTITANQNTAITVRPFQPVQRKKGRPRRSAPPPQKSCDELKQLRLTKEQAMALYNKGGAFATVERLVNEPSPYKLPSVVFKCRFCSIRFLAKKDAEKHVQHKHGLVNLEFN